MKIRASFAVLLLAVLAAACTTTPTTPRPARFELRNEVPDTTAVGTGRTGDTGHTVGSGG